MKAESPNLLPVSAAPALRRRTKWRGAAASAAVAILALGAEPSARATLLFGDNFNAPDTTNFDASDQTGRRTGLLASDIQLRSARIQQGIAGNQLNMLKPASGSGRIRFQSAADLPTNVWWDFATGAAGAQILEDGGLLVEFDWTPQDNTSQDWISFNLGFLGIAAGEPGLRVNEPQTDFGILFRNNGGTQHFDNGAATTGPSFPATLAQRHVSLLYSFNSFADGTNVTASAAVDGVSVLSDRVFQWENNSGSLYMELGNLAAGTRIDNLTVSTIPEPSTAGLLGLAALGLGMRRRRG